ncbi:MAG: RND family transporter, partial [Aristaeellaceae bacterium]
TIALDVLGEEYDGGIPNARVLVRDVTLPEALTFKDKLRDIDGVTEVTWLDDSVSLLQPLEVIDQKLLDTYYQDSCALYSLVIAEDKRVQAIADIRELIGDDNAVTGAAASTADATTSTVTQIMKIAIVAVIFVLCILLLTTTSWLEPFIVLGSLGVAIVINSGSNLIFGEISFVSNAAGPVLQLAVSLDYSVFLLHRFDECRKACPDKREAMVQALCRSTSSILSSGLTTVIGFLALCLMQFQIGPDLGLVLAKGVAISLLTVFLFSPVLILQCSTLMDRLHHRSFMPSFRRFGQLVTKVMLPVAAVFAVLLVPCYLAQGSNDYYYGSGKIFGPETRLGADTQDVEEVFGQSDTYVLMVPKGNTAREEELSAEIRKLNQVSDVLSFVDNAGASIPMEFLDEKTRSLLISDHYSRMVISVTADPEGEETFALIQQLRDMAQSCYPDEWLMAGEGVSTLDLKQTVTSDMTLVNLLAIGAVFVVLLVSFRSLSLPVILVLAIENAIWINLSIPYFRGQTIFYLAYLIISSIQLGATVDYAILFTDRYLENRRTMGRREAIIQTVSAVTVSVLTSGLTLTVVGFLLGYISTHGLLSQLGMFLGRGTICSMLIVLLALPGLLYLLDGVIRRTTRGAVFYAPVQDAASPEPDAQRPAGDDAPMDPMKGEMQREPHEESPCAAAVPAVD